MSLRLGFSHLRRSTQDRGFYDLLVRDADNELFEGKVASVARSRRDWMRRMFKVR